MLKRRRQFKYYSELAKKLEAELEEQRHSKRGIDKALKRKLKHANHMVEICMRKERNAFKATEMKGTKTSPERSRAIKKHTCVLIKEENSLPNRFNS